MTPNLIKTLFFAFLMAVTFGCQKPNITPLPNNNPIPNQNWLTGTNSVNAVINGQSVSFNLNNSDISSQLSLCDGTSGLNEDSVKLYYYFDTTTYLLKNDPFSGQGISTIQYIQLPYLNFGSIPNTTRNTINGYYYTPLTPPFCFGFRIFNPTKDTLYCTRPDKFNPASFSPCDTVNIGIGFSNITLITFQDSILGKIKIFTDSVNAVWYRYKVQGTFQDSLLAYVPNSLNTTISETNKSVFATGTFEITLPVVKKLLP